MVKKKVEEQQTTFVEINALSSGSAEKDVAFLLPHMDGKISKLAKLLLRNVFTKSRALMVMKHDL